MHESKTCPKCNIDRPLDRYYAYHGQCKNCLSIWQKNYYRKNPEKKNKGYTLSSDGYDALFAEQGGQCAICGTDKPGGKYGRLLVDHCHRSGKVRGLLCHACNSGLGMFKDNQNSLKKAVSYLIERGHRT